MVHHETDDSGDREGRRSRSRNRSRSRSLNTGHHQHDRDKLNDRVRERVQDRRRSRSPKGDGRARRHRERSYSRSPSPDHARERRQAGKQRSRSHSPRRRRRRRSRSSSASSSSSSDSAEHHRKRKDKHKRKRSRSRDRKEKKKRKKDKKKKSYASSSQWGKFGIINESNMYEKEAEFRTWLVEERKINPEVLSKDQTKKEFAKFAEDYNTATLPHEKYYNIDSFERRMSALRNGDTLPPVDDGYDPNADLLAHSTKHKKISAEKDTYLSKEHLQDLRKVQQERNQVSKMKLMGMNIKQSFGVRMDGNEFED